MDDNGKVKKKSKDGRSKDSVFRITLRNQVRLIEIADSKANMVIGINSLILSVIITVLTSSLMNSGGYDGNLFQNRVFAIPLLIIVISCLVSAVYAIIAAKPKIIRPKTKAKKAISERTSMFFFENFHRMPQIEFMRHFEQLLENSKEIHDHFTIDIHNQGRVLHRKYQLISISYTVFMFGFILGVSSFILIWLIY